MLIAREKLKTFMGKTDKSLINMLIELKTEIKNKIKSIT